MNPVWNGPLIDGITYSLLSRYLCCPERFRLYVMEGLSPIKSFDAPLEYGNMWHVCEEALASGGDWKSPLNSYCDSLFPTFPTDWNIINHWRRTCEVQFDSYLVFENSKNGKKRKGGSIYQEESFTVPYVLPSERNIVLRGKWDSVYRTGDIKRSEITLQENKTKGRIDEEGIERQLKMDLQTMLYVVALSFHLKGAGDMTPVTRVIYNVVRRPFTIGNKGYIKKRQATAKVPEETDDQFYLRLKNDYFMTEPEYWFKRWTVTLANEDVDRFLEKCLDPILENLVDDYEWWLYCHNEGVDPFLWKIRRREFPKHIPRHFVFPVGVYNSMMERGSSDLDEYMETGSTSGLERTVNLFPELA